MRYSRALIEQLQDIEMLPKMAIVDPGANGGLDFSQRTAPIFALDLFYSHVRRTAESLAVNEIVARH